MAHILDQDDGISPYLKARRRLFGEEKWAQLVHNLKTSTTLYVGNLSFYTTEEQIHEFFSVVGPVKRIHMGLNRLTKTPCGFCFVEYHTHEDAANSVKYLSGATLDDRAVRVDMDEAFTEGRQFGRAQTGGQVRDIHRIEYDPGRGGWAPTLPRGAPVTAIEATKGYYPGAAARTPDEAARGQAPERNLAESDRPQKRQRTEDTDATSEERNPRFRGDDEEERDDD